ncbi:phosphotyrosine protein phosphatase [Aestuariicella hydrocarbonica]|uniref:protein-tyrosine-phosphatase n=1 Tax=Pseudomaricurvus hydrocarbonicus TaxID=1470433 RepID=A0A9E5JSV1_9GAMM|nr:phosphotyrosine protein phosphatase [Aestuariicella hydrocarbonica]NHO64684.1 phosphotyrosine protein phosphatase [Aestuariicella hydrocarbonica]
MKYINDRYATERGLVRLGLAHIESWLGRTREFEQVDLSRVERLVFVCLGNICRSPFGEKLANQLGANTAGFGLSTTSGLPAFELAIDVAKRFGVDLSAHQTTNIDDFSIHDSDLLLVMEVRHARRLKSLIGDSQAQIALLGRWATPPRLHIHDPHEHDETYFYNCYATIEQATSELIKSLKKAQSISKDS